MSKGEHLMDRVNEIIDGLENLVTHPPSQDEINDALRINAAEQLRLKSNPWERSVTRVRNTLFPPTDVALTPLEPDEIARAARRIIAPWRMVILALGNRDLTSKLEQFGPTTVWSHDIPPRATPPPHKCDR